MITKLFIVLNNPVSLYHYMVVLLPQDLSYNYWHYLLFNDGLARLNYTYYQENVENRKKEVLPKDINWIYN